MMKKTILALAILGSFHLASCESRKAETNDNSQNSATSLESEGEMDNEASSATGSDTTADPKASGAGGEDGEKSDTLNTNNQGNR